VDSAVTCDLDILIALDDPESGPRSGSIEGWTVQFIPVAGVLDAEALAGAEEVDIEIDQRQGSAKTRVLRPEFIVASALRADRPKDRILIVQFLEEEAVDFVALGDIIGRHDLGAAWQSFCGRTGIADPLRRKITRMKSPQNIYSDISDILKAKAERRRDIARRSFGEKIAMMEALRERVAPFKRLREQRQAANRAGAPADAS
jgi:hypothetical protein